MKKLFRPAIVLMDRLMIPQKMVLMAIVFSSALLALLYLLVREINMDIAFTEKERSGVDYSQSVMGLFIHVQQHRGMANALLKGDEAFRSPLLEKQAQVESDIKMLDKAGEIFRKSLRNIQKEGPGNGLLVDIYSVGTINTADKWTSIKEGWRAVSEGVLYMTPFESYEAHTSLTKDILSLLVLVADTSNLTLDPEIDSFYMMDTIINKLPMAAEYAGQLRGIGAGVAAQQSIGEQERAYLILLSGINRSTIAVVKENMLKVFRKNPSLRPRLAPRIDDFDKFLSEAIGVLKSGILNTSAVSVSTEEYFSVFTKAIGSSLRLHSEITSSLKEVLDGRKSRLKKAKYMIVGFAIFAIAALSWLFAGYYFSMTNSLRRLMYASDSIRKGNLDIKVSLETRDEMGIVAQSFNEMSKSLNNAMKDLRHSNEEFQNFAFIASHDLKSPLISAASALKLINRRLKSGQLDEVDGLISDASNKLARMQDLVNDLLIFSRAGTHEVRFEDTDSAQALKHALDDLGGPIRESGAVVTHGELPRVTADPVQLGQLFQNLISNAIKFRGSGEILVHVEARRGAGGYIFSVRDNGIGIPAEESEKVFEMFYRLEKDKYPGTGIGLATCKKIVERLGGRIWVESVPGRGSTFFFSVPARGKINSHTA